MTWGKSGLGVGASSILGGSHGVCEQRTMCDVEIASVFFREEGTGDFRHHFCLSPWISHSLSNTHTREPGEAVESWGRFCPWPHHAVLGSVGAWRVGEQGSKSKHGTLSKSHAESVSPPSCPVLSVFHPFMVIKISAGC